jgi:hypothetical protein
MTAMPVKTYHKSVPERRRLYIDYTCWLEDTEKLTDIQVTITPYTTDAPLTVTTGYTDVEQKKIVMFVGAGAANIAYTLSMVVTTDQGQVKQDDIGMRVTP